LLRAASRRPRKASAPGLDGVTAHTSAAPLAKPRRAVPVRRRSGRSQAALDAHAFDEGADGLRQGRSPQEARHALRQRCMTEGRGWSVAAAVRGDGDRIDSTGWREVLRQRVHAGRMRRLLGPWRRAGVMDQGPLTPPETGGVPGGVLSPVWANVCRPHGLAAGVAREGRPRMQGRCVRRRCAEDCVIGCERERDARTMMAVLPKRGARCGLPMPPTPPPWMTCRPPEAHAGAASGNGPGDFLGWRHDWTTSRQGGGVSKRRTARQRRRRTTKSRWRWGRHQRHAPLPYQAQMRCATRRGHCQD
jgi:RNA-directed DNA polymerase